MFNWVLNTPLNTALILQLYYWFADGTFSINLSTAPFVRLLMVKFIFISIYHQWKAKLHASNLHFVELLKIFSFLKNLFNIKIYIGS